MTHTGHTVRNTTQGTFVSPHVIREGVPRVRVVDVQRRRRPEISRRREKTSLSRLFSGTVRPISQL